MELNREQITKNNELIAEFLGGTLREVWRVQGRSQRAWEGDVAFKFRKELFRSYIGGSILSEHLLFHSSWDWLKPAIDKIADIDNQADEELAEILTHEEFQVFKYSIMAPIHLVYEAVIEFITWYNNWLNQEDDDTSTTTRGNEAL